MILSHAVWFADQEIVLDTPSQRTRTRGVAADLLIREHGRGAGMPR